MRLEPLDGTSVFVLHDLLSPDECAALIARSEALGYEAAAVGGELLPSLRNNARAFLKDAALAADLWKRAAPFITAIDGHSPTGLHERFRFYRYETAEQFGIHMDGAVSRGEDEASRLTFMVYLSDVDEGGETNFYAPGRVLRHAVRPAAGKALAFLHERLHEGAAVRRGVKYVLRTDVLYRRA
ncbi:MAG: 2OG-Fe(II) oxygenase [Gemmataceae bacterium]|nr:2OG-Fe(II) oxygenase [Gemmataceae bacterium]